MTQPATGTHLHSRAVRAAVTAVMSYSFQLLAADPKDEPSRETALFSFAMTHFDPLSAKIRALLAREPPAFLGASGACEPIAVPLLARIA
jgi:hypothetical protein